jgi:hypothetical protein
VGKRKIVGGEPDRFTVGVVWRQVLLKQAVYSKGFETGKAGRFVVGEASGANGMKKGKFVVESRGGERPVPTEGNFL